MRRNHDRQLPTATCRRGSMMPGRFLCPSHLRLVLGGIRQRGIQQYLPSFDRSNSRMLTGLTQEYRGLVVTSATPHFHRALLLFAPGSGYDVNVHCCHNAQTGTPTATPSPSPTITNGPAPTPTLTPIPTPTARIYFGKGGGGSARPFEHIDTQHPIQIRRHYA